MSDCINVYEMIKALPYLIYLGKGFLNGCMVSAKPSGIIYYCLMGSSISQSDLVIPMKSGFKEQDGDDHQLKSEGSRNLFVNLKESG